MRDTILFGDCRETLKEFDGKARMCVTSPPYYGLRNYGDEDSQIGQEQTPEEFIDELVKVEEDEDKEEMRKYYDDMWFVGEDFEQAGVLNFGFCEEGLDQYILVK